jgi:hypothetical protein
MSQPIIYLIDYLTEKFKNDMGFILIPSFNDNYYYAEISTQLKRKFLDVVDDIETIFPEKEKKLSFLIYPHLYNENILMISLLAHEIGHYIEMKYNVTNDLMSHINLDMNIIKEIAKTRSAERVGDKGRTLESFWTSDTIIADTNKQIVNLINHWIKELFCDLIGFKLIGPMYLFVNAEFFLSSVEPTLISTDYPSIEFRLKFLMDEFEQSDYKAILRNSDGVFKSYGEKIEDIKRYLDKIKIDTTENTIGNVSYRAVDSIKDLLYKKVDEIVKQLNMAYDPELFKSEVLRLTDILKLPIVPCEISQGTPANMISILNAGEIFRILMLKEKYNEIKDTFSLNRDDFEYKIDELIIGGVEFCGILKEYKKAISEMNKNDRK